MKKFQFPLQKVFDYKTHLEEREKAVLADMRARHQGLVNQLEGMRREYERCRRDYDQKCRGDLVLADLLMIKNYMIQLQAGMERMMLIIQNSQKEIDRQVDQILGLSRDNSSMEHLRDKHLSAYRKSEQKEEEIFIEDFVANAKFVSSLS